MFNYQMTVLFTGIWVNVKFPSDSVCFIVGCLTSQQHASVSPRRIYTDNFTCCHTEIEVADPTFYLTQSQYTDTGQTRPSADPIMPGAYSMVSTITISRLASVSVQDSIVSLGKAAALPAEHLRLKPAFALALNFLLENVHVQSIVL